MKQSAGILLYKSAQGRTLFFLVHPGGPFWKNKDEGAWSIPKGEYSEEEDPLETALREFTEETGVTLSVAAGKLKELSPVRLKSGKRIVAWTLEHDINADRIVSNTFELEWPPGSGKMTKVPEIDRAAWFTAEEALLKINEAQQSFIHETLQLISGEG